MLGLADFSTDAFVGNCNNGKEVDHFKKGQRILYKKEEAEILSVRPVLVIKVNRKVICGNLYKDIHSVQKDMH
jgi:hypothetical protein